MSIKDLTITDQNVKSTYVQSQPDRLTGTAQQNKAVFDALPQLIIQRFNLLLEALAGTGAAGEIPVGPIEGVTAENVQQALEAIQKNLTAYINKIKAATGAAEVGVSTISGMTAQNVQKALEELRTDIDNIVSGIIPGGSITSDMLADMTGPIRWGNNRYISGGGSSTDFDFAAGKVSIRLSPENAVGNDISKCVVIRDTGTGAVYPIATATTAKEHAIVPKNGATLIDGFQNSYSKDQFGKVNVFFSLKFERVPEKNTEIFSLPQSFAPKSNVVGIAGFFMGSSNLQASVTASASGAVRVFHNITEYSGSLNLHGFLVVETGGTQ